MSLALKTTKMAEPKSKILIISPDKRSNGRRCPDHGLHDGCLASRVFHLQLEGVAAVIHFESATQDDIGFTDRLAAVYVRDVDDGAVASVAGDI